MQIGVQRSVLESNEPTLLFLPRPDTHRLVTDDSAGANVVCVTVQLTQGGTLAGLADPRLAKALIAIQDDPALQWSLTSMAELAGMSRARFAVKFREVTGETPADYLAS